MLYRIKLLEQEYSDENTRFFAQHKPEDHLKVIALSDFYREDVFLSHLDWADLWGFK